MQTLKTAAIVVLLMTVMYGAYVSLTTPPEPLPADVQTMLEFSDGDPFALDPGLPESLGNLEIHGSPSASASGVEAPSNSSFDLTTDVESAQGAASALGGGTLDHGTPDHGAPASGPSGFASAESTLGGSSTMIPPLTDSQTSVDDVTPGYPSTGSSFDLPDPNSLASSIDPAQANVAPVNVASGNRNADLTNDLALASGTTDPNALELPATASNVQRASLADASSSSNLGFANAVQTADKQYLNDKRSDALATLSIFYNAPNLSGEQRSELLSRLDPLAREVIYSKSHLLEMPHRVGQNETLMDIAQQYEVPWQLLANINQIRDPVTILPGTELKVVQGPFRAEVNLTTRELTLFLGDLYAGRFPIGIGSDPAPKPGTYTIQDKQSAKTYYDHAGSPVPPGSPENPYGNAWLDLGSQLSIHGSPSTTSPTEKGCISLAADYADDLYGILSQGSSVTIRR